MIKKFVTILVLLVAITYCSADLCESNLTIADFPDGIKANLFALIYHTAIKVGDCKDATINDSLIEFWYYSRETVDNPILLNKNNPEQIDPTKPTVMLIHGWLCSLSKGGFPELIAAYLKRYNCNIVGIQWTPYAVADLGTSYCSVTLIAELVGNFICSNDLDADKIHIVGHSFGGQMAGLIGQVVQQCSKQINRITAMDPAGPMYQNNPPSKRLDAQDAKSVDVIHTNSGLLGYFGSCGTTDFFPNCGVQQPGCLNLTTVSLSDLINIPTRDLNCNHFRSVYYMAESINSDRFVGKSSILYPVICLQDFFPSSAIMGEDCPSITSRNKYLLNTNSQPPYALG